MDGWNGMEVTFNLLHPALFHPSIHSLQYISKQATIHSCASNFLPSYPMLCYPSSFTETPNFLSARKKRPRKRALSRTYIFYMPSRRFTTLFKVSKCNLGGSVVDPHQKPLFRTYFFPLFAQSEFRLENAFGSNAKRRRRILTRNRTTL